MSLSTVLPVSIPTKRLSSSISATDTTFRLSDILGWDGTALTAADFGQVAYGAFRDSNGTVLELFSFDPTTIASGDISFVLRGLDFSGDRTTAIAANKLEWVKNTTLVELGSTFPQLYQYLKEYIDNIAITGAPVATNLVAGIVKTSVAAASPSNPIAVGDNDGRVPTQSENDALVGSQGSPSSSNKYVTQQATYTTELDQQQTSHVSSTAIGQANSTGNRNKIAQSFIATNAKIRGLRLWKIADTGTFTGTVKIALQADAAGSPSGSDLASYTITNAVWLKILAAQEFPVWFSTEYGSIVIGSTYWIVITPSTSDSSNCINLGSAGNVYANGVLKYNNTTDGWVAPGADLYFKTVIGVQSQVVGIDSTGFVPPTVGQYQLIALDRTMYQTSANVANAVAYEVVLPAGYFTANSGVRILLRGKVFAVSASFTGTIDIQINGTSFYTLSVNTNKTYNGVVELFIKNNGSLGSQLYIRNGLLSDGGSAPTLDVTDGTSSVDTSGEVVIQVLASANSTAGNVYAEYDSSVIERIG